MPLNPWYRPHRLTLISVVILFLLFISMNVINKPHASYAYVEGIGKVVNFKWYGWPRPMTHGTLPDNGKGTPEEIMNSYMSPQVVAFSIGVLGGIAVFCTILLGVIIELFIRLKPIRKISA